MESKLLAIQMELKAPKEFKNNFGNYNYRSCEGILEAVKPLLGKHKCTMYLDDEIVSIGNRVYVRATATLMEGEKKIIVTAYAREEETKKGMDASQITGAASSYARKYALNGLFLIDDNRDADSTNTHGKDEAGALREPLPLKVKVESDIPGGVGVFKTVSVTAVTKSGNPPMYYVKTEKDGVFKTNKEVVALLAKGRIGKGPTKVVMTVDNEMEAVIMDVVI